MIAQALAVVLAATPGAAVVVAPPPPRAASAQTRPLDGPADVRALCGALVPTERLAPRGDVVARARAEEAHEARREEALDGHYRVVVPGARLRFEEYDPEAQRLLLSDRSFLSAAGGSLQIWLAEDRGLPVFVDPALAERVARGAARRTLTLHVVFTLPEDGDEVTCGHVSGSARYALGVEPVSWEYREGERVLARGGEGGHRPLVGAQGATPRVRLAEPVGEAGRALQAAVQARQGDLLACYRSALQGDPALDGSLVAELAPAAGRAAPAVRVAAESVQDPGLVRCVREVLARVAAPPAREHATLSVHFELVPPEAAPAASPTKPGAAAAPPAGPR